MAQLSMMLKNVLEAALLYQWHFSKLILKINTEECMMQKVMVVEVPDDIVDTIDGYQVNAICDVDNDDEMQVRTLDVISITDRL